MTWFFLVLSLAFFLVRGFRPALEAPLIALLLPEYWTAEYGAAAATKRTYQELGQSDWRVRLLDAGTGRVLERLYTLERYVTPEQLRHMGVDAEKRGDTEFMAFAALHLPQKQMREDIFRLVDRLVALNPKLTWVIYGVAMRDSDEWESEPVAESLLARVDKLAAWDPDNAAPYLLRAGMIRAQRDKNWKGARSDASAIKKILEQDLRWQNEMQAAFAQPRYDSYILRRFQLDCRVMLARRWDNPVVMLYAGPPFSAIYPSLAYARLVVKEMGADAEAQGRMDDALRHYWAAARFGERLRLQGHSLFEELVGYNIQATAYERLVPALKTMGRANEAAALEYAGKQSLNELNRLWRDPPARTSNSTWAAFLMAVAGTAVWVFLFLSLASVGYVNAKLWIRREKKGRLYQGMTILENYAPLALLFSCLVLALAYAPFAENFATYTTATGPINWLDRLAANSYPIPQDLWRTADLPLQNPYPGYVTWALAGAGLVALVMLLVDRLSARK